jgi:D-alanyl-D-alanine carboxypeptidase (penicillin-binding protein 5/6)
VHSGAAPLIRHVRPDTYAHMRNNLAMPSGATGPAASTVGRWALGALLLLATPDPSPAQAPKPSEGFQTAAPYAILIDAESDSVLFEKNADQLSHPASLAKLMTVELVLHEVTEGRLDLNTEFVISENAWRRGGAPSGGSAMFAPLHSRVRVEDLLRGVIVQSGNDACIALAEGIAGNEAQFATMMNKRARELGLTKSEFRNASGLHDPDMKVTVRELAKLAQHIIKTYPEHYKIYNEREFTWNKIRQQNRNPLLAMGIGADGLKTGFIKESGYGLVGSAVQNGLRLIVAVNGLKSAKERADEGRKLLDWGFRAFEARLLFAEGETVGEAKLFGGATGRVPLTSDRPIRLLVQRGQNEKIVARIVYNGPVPAPVEKGRPIGRLKVWRGDNVALEVPLQAGESVGQGNIAQRAFDAASELVVGLFRAGAERL